MLPFGDREFELFRQRRFIASFLGGTLGAWLLFTRPVVVDALGMQPHIVSAYTLIYFFAQLGLLADSRRAWVRVTCTMTLLASGFIYGASSTQDLSPAWVFVVPMAHLGARLGVHRHPSLLAIFALTAPALHLALAPAPSVGSSWAACWFGAGGAMMLSVMGRRADEAVSLHTDEPLDGRELAVRRSLVSRVALAMTVHDRLSGLIVGVRFKAKHATTHAELSDGVDALIERTTAVLEQGGDTLRATLARVRDAVEAQGAALDVRLDLQRPLTPEEETDVRDISSEACLNAARRGPGTLVQLHLVSDAQGLTLSCIANGGGTPASGQGRGLRNMRLRAWARGGSFFVDTQPGHSTLRLTWPVRSVVRRFGPGMGTLMAALAVAPTLATGRLDALLAVCAVSALAGLSFFQADAAHERALRRLERQAGPSLAPPLEVVRHALAPSLAALIEARRLESRVETERALRSLSEAMTALLSDLERDAFPLMPQLDAPPPRAPYLPFDGLQSALLGWRLVAATALSTVLLSLPVVADVVQVPVELMRAINSVALCCALAVAALRASLVRAPWAAPFRAAMLCSFNALCATSGALSSDAIGVGWLLLVLTTYFNGQFPLHRARSVLVFIALAPVVMRALWVPNASVFSLGCAAIFGLLSAVASWLLARRTEAIEKLQTGELLEEREVVARGAVVEGLSTAMELHDGVGGELLRLRLSTRQGLSWGELEPQVDRVLKRADELLRDVRHPVLLLPEQLSQLAASAGRKATVALEGAAESLTPGEWSDVWSLTRRFVLGALELPPAPVHLTLRVDRGRVSLRVSGSAALLSLEGRPMRNAKLRVWSRGGTMRAEGEGALRLEWSRRRWPRAPFGAALVAGGVVLLAGLHGVAVQREGGVAVSMVMGLIGFFVFSKLGERRAALLARLEALREREAATFGTAALSVVRGMLEQPLAALSEARAVRSPDAAAQAARSLSEALVETVSALEQPSLQALGPMSRAPAASLR